MRLESPLRHGLREGGLGGHPETIGPYRITGHLGEGGMGVVYRAVHGATGLEVALKTSRNLVGDLALFRQEIRALSRVRHPRIVRVLDEGVDGGLPWYAMEFVAGRTLKEAQEAAWGRSGTPFESTSASPIAESTWSSDGVGPVTGGRGGNAPTPPPVRPPAAAGRLVEVLTLFRRLCAPIGMLHGHGIVHRDIKPANVIVRADGTPVLMDLGVASRFRGAVGRERLEVAGRVVGTLPYMSPEQAEGRRVDARADLYSLGCTLYESVTGQVPFQGGSVSELIARIAWEPPVPPSALVDGVPVELEALILALLTKSRRQRPGYAEDVARALERLGAEDDSDEVVRRPYLYRADLVGRDAELAALEARADAVARGGGAVVVVGGESGVGKTCLVAEAASRARTRRLDVVLGEALPPVAEGTETALEIVGAPLHPLRSLLQSVADFCRARGPEVTAQVVGARSTRLAGHEPAFAALAGVVPEPEPPGLEPNVVRDRLHQALHDTLTTWIALRGPILLVLDDLHWADDLTLGWLQRCARTPVPGLLVVGTFRTDAVASASEGLLREAGVTRIDLARLGGEAVERVVADMLALEAAPPDLARTLYALSEGNPFFLAEYLRMAIAEGHLRREQGQWTFQAGGGALSEPRSVRDVAIRRLATLDPEVRAVAGCASVLGRAFLVRHLAALRPGDDAALGETLRELEVRQVVAPVGDARFSFTHDKLREAAYAALDPARRRALNRRAAEVVEADEGPPPHALLAHLWREAEEWDRAVDHLEQAAWQALRTCADRDAIARFEEALALVPRMRTPPPRLRLARWERALTDAHGRSGSMTAPIPHGDRALVLLGEPGLPASRAGRALALLREVLRQALPGSLGATRLPRRADRLEALREAVEVHARLLDPLANSNQFALSFYCGLRAMNLGGRLPDSGGRGRVLTTMALILSLTPLRPIARRWADVGVQVAECSGSDDALSRALCAASNYHLHRGDWERYRQRITRAEAIALRIGDARRLDEARLQQVILAVIRGRFGEHLEHATSGLASAAARQDPQVAAWCRTVLIEHGLRLGRTEEVAEHVREARALFARAPIYERPWLRGAVALAALRGGGDLDAAVDEAAQALDALREVPPLLFYFVAPFAGLAEACIALWDDAAARGAPDPAKLAALIPRLVRQLRVFTRFMPFTPPFADLWSGAWLARTGKPRRARRLLRRALADAERLDLWHVEANAALELARLAPPAEQAALVARPQARLDSGHAAPDAARARRLFTN
jgi:serine/threonine protein kinase